MYVILGVQISEIKRSKVKVGRAKGVSFKDMLGNNGRSTFMKQYTKPEWEFTVGSLMATSFSSLQRNHTASSQCNGHTVVECQFWLSVLLAL